MFGKKATGKGNLAFKMSISFHPEDNVTPEQAFIISNRQGEFRRAADDEKGKGNIQSGAA